jgi:hypothetical protein
MSNPVQQVANPWLPRSFESGGNWMWLFGNLAVAAGYFALALIVSRFFAA